MSKCPKPGRHAGGAQNRIAEPTRRSKIRASSFGFPSTLGFRHWEFRHAGSNPAVLTGNKRAEVQMEARLLREQEGSGSTPECPTLQGSRGLVAQTRLITA
jgi:hypothetical protein